MTFPQAGSYPLTRAAVADVYACLHKHGRGVQCPELAPSDVWGLYPVDCGDAPCDVGAAWADDARTDTLMPGWRLLLEGRGGLWLPNYAVRPRSCFNMHAEYRLNHGTQHVNATYNSSIHYAASSAEASSHRQAFCPPIADGNGGPAARTPMQEEAFDAAENVVARFVRHTALSLSAR